MHSDIIDCTVLLKAKWIAVLSFCIESDIPCIHCFTVDEFRITAEVLCSYV